MDDRETKEMLSRVERNVSPFSNLTQQDSTPLNTSQQGVQMRSTCRAQCVESLNSGQILVHLYAALQIYLFSMMFVIGGFK